MSTPREELQRAILRAKAEQARRRLEAEDAPVREALGNTAAGFNRGVLQAVGLPVDLLNTAAGLVGLDVEEPVGGFKSLERLAQGVQFAGQTGFAQPDPASFAGRAAESVGATAVPLGAVGGASRLSRAGGALLEGFRRTPGRFVALETAAGVGGGLGAATARELFPESRLAEAGGEVAGAVVNPVQLGAALARAGRNRLRRTVTIFTPKGQQRRAGIDLLENAENPEAVRRVVGNRDFQESILTPAQATGDRGLMTLERSAARFSAQAERRFADTVDEINSALRAQLDELPGPGQPLQARQVLDAEVTRLDTLIDANVDAALRIARQKIDDLGGLDVVSRTNQNSIVRQQLVEAKAASRVQEAELWDSVPGKALAGTRGTENGYSQIVGVRPRTADPADIPEFVHEFLRPEKGATKLGGSEGRATVEDLLGLRSRMLDAVAAEDALGKGANKNKIRILNSLQEDILDDLGQLGKEALGVPSEVAESIARARESSRLHNDKFSRGDIGRVLGRSRDRAPTVQPELTLETLIGQASPKAAPNADAILRAVGDNPETRRALTEHINQRFLGAATDTTGSIVPTRAETFLRNNAQLLDRFPAARRQLEDATFAQRGAAEATAAAKVERAILHDKNRNVAALFLNGSPSREINKVLQASPEPVKGLRDLKAAMRGDAGGEAGLKAAFVREMIGRAELSKFDATGRPGFDANHFRKEVVETAKLGREAGVLSAEDITRMERIAEVAQKAQASSQVQSRNLSELVGTDIGTGLFDLITRISAANVGGSSAIGRSSGASLVSAGFTVRWARRLLAQTPSVKIRNILAEAMFDKDLFELLLKRAGSPEEAVELSQRLNGWLINLGIERQETEQ